MSVCAFKPYYRLIISTACHNSNGFDTHEPHSTHDHDEIDSYDIEDDGYWLEPGRVYDQTNDPVFEYSPLGHFRDPMEFNNHDCGKDLQSTSTAFDPHSSTATQSYTTNTQEQFCPSTGPQSRNMHGIRLRPISDLRLFLKISSQTYIQFDFFSGCIQRNLQVWRI